MHKIQNRNQHIVRLFAIIIKTTALPLDSHQQTTKLFERSKNHNDVELLVKCTTILSDQKNQTSVSKGLATTACRGWCLDHLSYMHFRISPRNHNQNCVCPRIPSSLIHNSRVEAQRYTSRFLTINGVQQARQRDPRCWGKLPLVGWPGSSVRDGPGLRERSVNVLDEHNGSWRHGTKEVHQTLRQIRLVGHRNLLVAQVFMPEAQHL